VSNFRTDILEQARKLRPVIELAAQSLDDATASTAPVLFPTLKLDGQLVRAGTRINWHGEIKRAAADLWDNANNDPDHAPTLWESLGYRNGIRIIPEIITAGTAFVDGELGWWGDALYRSKLPANVYTPAQYPDGWEAVV
jgi:hypothetical protein